jgi:hypothetical protein
VIALGWLVLWLVLVLAAFVWVCAMIFYTWDADLIGWALNRWWYGNGPGSGR